MQLKCYILVSVEQLPGCSERSSKNGSNVVILPFTSNGDRNVFKERFHSAEDMVGVSEATGNCNGIILVASMLLIATFPCLILEGPFVFITFARIILKHYIKS